MNSYMFDTNIFNYILDGKIDLNPYIKKAKFFVTHVQYDELNNTSNDKRRQALLTIFQEVTQVNVPTESFVLDASRLDAARLGGSSMIPTESGVWDISNWDQTKWTLEDNLYEPIKAELDKLNKGKRNNIQDALIAETSIKNNLILVTHDKDLFSIVLKYGGSVANLQAVLKEL